MCTKNTISISHIYYLENVTIGIRLKSEYLNAICCSHDTNKILIVNNVIVLVKTVTVYSPETLQHLTLSSTTIQHCMCLHMIWYAGSG